MPGVHPPEGGLMANGMARVGTRWGVVLAVAALLSTGLACNENELQGLIPDIFVNPDEVQFGTVTAGVTSEQLLAVHNSGGGTLTVESVVIQDGSSGFSVEEFTGEITPEAFVELTVSFDPVQLGPAEDVIVITSDDPDEPEVLVPVYAVDVLPAPEPAIAWSPSSLDWGAVLSGQSITKVVTLSSVGTSDLEVLTVYLATGTSSDFYLVGNPAPVTLAPGAVTEVQVSYAPSDEAPDAGNLMISSNDPDTPQAMVPLTGELEQAPDIELIPTTLAFDQPGVGNGLTMDAQVWNVGDLDLELGALSMAGSPEFSLDADPSMEVVAPGEFTTVVVRYAPTDATADMGTVLIPSNDPDENPAILALTAPAPYPIIEADPWSVDFGDVKIGTTASEWVLVSNVGTADLELYSVTIGGNQSFSVTSNPAGTTLAPGDSVQMEVTFDPVWEATVMGTADIASNDPSTPVASVTLQGNGAASGIEIDPDTVSFGQVGAGCEMTADIHVKSVGTVPLDLYSYAYTVIPTSAMTMDPGDLDDYVAYGWELMPGEEITVTVSFIPDDVVVWDGLLSVDSDDPYTPTAEGYQDGEGLAGGFFQDAYLQQGNNWTDVLWVVDNSCSMGDEQGKLGDDFSYFHSIINAAGVDYRLATVTTDNYYFQGGTKVIDNNTPNGASVFESNCNLGTSGSGTERGMYEAWEALSLAVNNSYPNDGFYRVDAGLRIVFVSDENDDSGNWSGYTANFQSLKLNPDHVILSAICGTDGFNAVSCSGAGGYADPGSGYVEGVNQTGGILASICDADWSSALTNMAWMTINLADTFALTYQAIPNTIEVYVNGVLITTGWSYDPLLNAVVFDPAYVPDDGDNVEIDYGYFGSC